MKYSWLWPDDETASDTVSVILGSQDVRRDWLPLNHGMYDGYVTQKMVGY